MTCFPCHRQHGPAGLLRLIQSVLLDGWMLDGLTFDRILKPAAGGDWRTRKGKAVAGAIASAVLDPDVIVGIRHRHRTRSAVIDIDHHPGLPASPYWQEDGPGEQLQQLIDLAAAAGIEADLLRSSASGGWHLHLALPQAVHHQEAHWIARQLLDDAGLDLGQGKAEVFPSEAPFTTGNDAKTWVRCHGVRLPGQAGSALWTGRGWADDQELIWSQLQASLQAAAEASGAPAWRTLQQRAVALQKRTRKALQAHVRAYRRKATGAIRHHVRWTGKAQSNRLLGKLANAAWFGTTHTDPVLLGRVIHELALAAPGFQRWASEDTKRVLLPWCIRWAASVLRKPPIKGLGTLTQCDPGHNARLRRETICRITEAAKQAARVHGAGALELSERAVARLVGVARNSIRALRGCWDSALQMALTPPAGQGLEGVVQTPSPTGGASWAG